LRWLGREQPDLAEAREAASRIIKDATRAADIISRVRLLFEKGTAQKELVDINEVIREMIILLGSEANRHSISIRVDLAEDLPKVMADRVQLQQVFMNLMLNGIDAMKGITGGGELTIKSQRGENEQLVASVSDTGVGLPAEQADQIFNAFFNTKPKPRDPMTLAWDFASADPLWNRMAAACGPPTIRPAALDFISPYPARTQRSRWRSADTGLR
jgi:signal transduction histidine kinase